MKKMPTVLISAALACSIAPMPAYALGGVASQRAAMTQKAAITQRASMTQRAGKSVRTAMNDMYSNAATAFGMKGQRAVMGQQASAQQSGVLNIREAGTYVLNGNLRGTVRVDPGAGDVRLVMDNAVIDGNGGPAIQAISGDSLTIMMPEGSNSRVFSSGTNGDCKGTIQSSVETFFEGPGDLTVVGNQQPGINTQNADLTFNGGNFQIFSGGDGMSAEGSQPGRLTINGGDFKFSLDGGIMSPNTTVERNGGSFEWNDSKPNFDFDTYAEQNPWTGGSMQQAGQQQGQQQAGAATQQQGQPQQNQQQGEQPGATGQQQGLTGNVTTAGTIVTSTAQNTASELEANMDEATYYVVSDEDGQVKISEAGTYVVSGTSSDGNITVKKGTTGVVLVLDNLDLTSTTGATLSVNKQAEVKIIVSGNVVLTDNENPEDENSTDADVADAYDGAALKAKAGSQVYITGDGTLTINGNAKNGIKAGDESSLVIDGTTLNINATNDGINANYDLTVLSGNVTIEAGDDAIHADHILTIGAEDGTGPTIDVKSSTEGLEGTVVNILGGDIDINSTDDAINAANADGVYEGELDYSINMTGGDVTINSRGDGMDSNGNINLIGGTAVINSSAGGGEAGIDYDGNLYVSNEFQLNNNSGVAGPDGMGGMPGQMGQMGQQPGQMDGQQPGQMGGQQPGQMGQQPGQMGGQQSGQMGRR